MCLFGTLAAGAQVDSVAFKVDTGKLVKELRHAEHIYEFGVKDMDDIQKVYTLNMEDMEKWEHCKKHFAEKSAWIRHMLA